MGLNGKGLWSRWALVAAVLAMAASLSITVWVTYRGVDAASQALVRGQAATLQAGIREAFRERGGKVSEADLIELHELYASQGLRYMALVDKRRAVISVGTTSTREDHLRDSIARARAGELYSDAGVVRFVLRSPSGRRVGRQDSRPPPIYVEFVPEEALALRASSQRSLAIGSTASVLLLMLAAFMGRLLVQQEQHRRQLDEDRRLRSLGRMSAVLAHEIRNPLASLKGNAQLLETMIARAPEPSAKLVGKAQRVVNEATRLEELISDLLDFARTGALRRGDCDPGQLLHDSAALVAQDGIALDCARAPRRFSIDAGRMQQVLRNLLQNAVETGTAVQASASLDDGRLVFCVRDHGEGIDENEMASLFEPFHTKKVQGTGLGLAVAKHIVELHGGTIRARNSPGGGAEFVVVLPPV